MVKIMLDKGWFTSPNNLRGVNLVKGRLDRFLVSTRWLDRVPFFSSEVVRQTRSNYDVVILDTEGCKPRDTLRDPEASFQIQSLLGKGS